MVCFFLFFFTFYPSSCSAYYESIFIHWHRFSWFLQNALIHGFWNLWFQTLQAIIKWENCISLDFFFSWFKWTTKSAKISSPRLIINSQYISLLCAFGIVCFYFIRSKYYYMLSVFCFLFLFYSFKVLYCAVGVNSYFTTSISVCLICSSIHKQFILITSAINVITVSMPVTLG